MLSNTAVPKYYGQFRDAVLRGEIPVNEEISMQMNRIDERILDPRYYYDPAPVDAIIRFWDNELTLVDGSDWETLESFKIWLEDLYGWYYFVKKKIWVPSSEIEEGHYEYHIIKKRLTTKQYLIVGRGAAKSLYETGLHAYGLCCDNSTTNQITTSPTMRQSEEVMSPLKTALTRSRGPLFKFLTYGSKNNTTGADSEKQSLLPTKKGIENKLTNSLMEIKPLSIDKLQGMRCKYATLDEWLSGVIREDPIGAIEQGATKNNDYWIISVSSEGTIRNGVGDSIKMELRKILKGEYAADHISIWWYKMDSIEEIAYPELWPKCNPNIGITVSYETYQKDVERAEQVPAARNDILAKRFGIETEGFTFFFTYDEIIPHRQTSFDGMSCSMGCDLSQGNDFCAFTFLFPLSDGSFGIKTRCYITDLTLNKLALAMRVKYEEFIREGSLVILNGTLLNIEDVYTDLYQYIDEHNYDVSSVGYDPYNAKEFINQWCIDNGPFGVEKVIQGAKTETVPLGELKNLAEARMLIFDQSIFSFTMGNSIVIKDTNGNMKLLKQKYDAKIDSVAAAMDALVAYKLHKDNFM